jgi:hypothetical protein
MNSDDPIALGDSDAIEEDIIDLTAPADDTPVPAPGQYAGRITDVKVYEPTPNPDGVVKLILEGVITVDGDEWPTGAYWLTVKVTNSKSLDRRYLGKGLSELKTMLTALGKLSPGTPDDLAARLIGAAVEFTMAHRDDGGITTLAVRRVAPR